MVRGVEGSGGGREKDKKERKEKRREEKRRRRLRAGWRVEECEGRVETVIWVLWWLLERWEEDGGRLSGLGRGERRCG